MDTKACKTIKNYMAIYEHIRYIVGFHRAEYSKMLKEVQNLSETYPKYSEIMSIVHGFTMIKFAGGYSLYVNMAGSRRMYPWHDACYTVLRKYWNIPVTVIQTIYRHKVSCLEDLRPDMFSVDVDGLDDSTDYYARTDDGEYAEDDYRHSTIDLTTTELLESSLHKDYPMRSMYLNYYNMAGKCEDVNSHYKVSCMILAKHMYDKGLISSKPSILLEAIKSLESKINTLTDKVSRLERMVTKDS